MGGMDKTNKVTRYSVEVRTSRGWSSDGTCLTRDIADRFAADETSTHGADRVRVRELVLEPMLAFQMGLISSADLREFGAVS